MSMRSISSSRTEQAWAVNRTRGSLDIVASSGPLMVMDPIRSSYIRSSRLWCLAFFWYPANERKSISFEVQSSRSSSLPMKMLHRLISLSTLILQALRALDHRVPLTIGSSSDSTLRRHASNGTPGTASMDNLDRCEDSSFDTWVTPIENSSGRSRMIPRRLCLTRCLERMVSPDRSTANLAAETESNFTTTRTSSFVYIAPRRL
mmetsp:Transcript_26137/g.71682  ORF Transcript_26137/g.71682 Transcript_26137/m.71682 type:complete len:205 (+) Transcript_26137:210-824(+)